MIIDKKWAGSGRCKNHTLINFLSHVMSPPVSDAVDSDRLSDQIYLGTSSVTGCGSRWSEPLEICFPQKSLTVNRNLAYSQKVDNCSVVQFENYLTKKIEPK